MIRRRRKPGAAAPRHPRIVTTAMEGSWTRRVGALARHLGDTPHAPQPLRAQATAGGGAAPSCSHCGCSCGDGREGGGGYHASATGEPTSYERVHGSPSRAPARWRRLHSVAREELREVKYEKAEGEGIAKASWGGGRRACVPAPPPHAAPPTPPTLSHRSPSTARRSATRSPRAQVLRGGGAQRWGASEWAGGLGRPPRRLPHPPTLSQHLPHPPTHPPLPPAPLLPGWQCKRCLGALPTRGTTLWWG